MRIRSTQRAHRKLADEELISLFAQGDPAAFEVFYERHAGAAYSLAHRIMGGPAAAQEVTQDAFVSIWHSRERYDAARGSARVWLLSVLRNRAVDALRQRARRPMKAAVEAEEVLEFRAGEERTDEEAIRLDTSRRLRGVLAELPIDQSQVLELAYFGGFTHSEIAEMLAIPLGTVKGRMRLGLERIRSDMAEGLA